MEVYFASLEDIDHQYKSDLYFDEDDDEDLVSFMAPVYRDMLTCSYGSKWWDRIAKATFSPSFYNKIQRIRIAWSAEKSN